MTRRIKIDAILAPAGIYQREARPVSGYRPTADSPFAVVRVGAGPSAHWKLIHVKSGGSIDSPLPARGYHLTLTHKLAVAAAWTAATHLDWSAFDKLPAVTLETTEAPGLKNPSPVTLAEMRRLADMAIG
jgi:hypothetical protein